MAVPTEGWSATFRLHGALEPALAADLAQASGRPRLWETAGLRLQREGARTTVRGAPGRAEVTDGTGEITVVVDGARSLRAR